MSAMSHDNHGYKKEMAKTKDFLDIQVAHPSSGSCDGNSFGAYG